jgi:hypothetical protein
MYILVKYFHILAYTVICRHMPGHQGVRIPDAVLALPRPGRPSRPALWAAVAFSGKGAGAPPHPGAPPRTFNTLSTRAQPDRQPFSRIRTHPPAPQITLRGQGSRTLVYSRAGQGKTGVAGDRRSLLPVCHLLMTQDAGGSQGHPTALSLLASALSRAV